MRIALCLVLLGCSDDPHELGTCDPTWTPGGMTLEQAGVTQCELACESEPANHDATGMDMPCAATASEGKATITVRCDRTISFGDQRGCCAQVEGDINGESWLVFAACD